QRSPIMARRNRSSQLSVALSARFAVTSILTVCSISSSLALTVEPRSVSHCDVHVLVARPSLHGADINAIPKFVGDERIPETMQLDLGHAGVFRLELELIEEMNVRVDVLVREQQPLGQCQQFRQESIAHWDAARACRGLGLPDVPATDALFTVEARLLPNEDFLRAGTDVGVVQVRDLHVPASR